MSKNILITGAGTGIGAAIALDFAPGNEIFVHYNSSKEAAGQVAQEVVARGGHSHLLQADLTTDDGCRSLVNALKAETDKLDVLVNNSGGLIKRQPVRDLDWSLMQEVFALNTLSAMKMTSLCLPLLEKGDNPCIINLTSIAIRHGAPTATVYGASKGALDSFTRGAAKELAPVIRVNAIAPGVIETPFHDKVTTPERLEEMRKNTPMQKNGIAEDLTAAVRLLVENNFITGETIDINGGLFMR